MTILYDTILDLNYIEIVPIKANFADTNMSTRLYVVSNSDNLVSFAVFEYQLCGEDRTKYYSGLIPMSGADYSNWNGSNDYPFTYILNTVTGIVPVS